MSEPAEIHERVTRLEIKMAEVYQLASGASSEVSDVHARLRAHTKSLEALRKTQVEQGRQIHDGFARVDGRFAQLEGEMRGGFSMLKAGQVQITALLNTELKKSDETDTSSEGAGG